MDGRSGDCTASSMRGTRLSPPCADRRLMEGWSPLNGGSPSTEKKPPPCLGVESQAPGAGGRIHQQGPGASVLQFTAFTFPRPGGSSSLTLSTPSSVSQSSSGDAPSSPRGQPAPTRPVGRCDRGPACRGFGLCKKKRGLPPQLSSDLRIRRGQARPRPYGRPVRSHSPMVGNHASTVHGLADARGEGWCGRRGAPWAAEGGVSHRTTFPLQWRGVAQSDGQTGGALLGSSMAGSVPVPVALAEIDAGMRFHGSGRGWIAAGRGSFNTFITSGSKARRDVDSTADVAWFGRPPADRGRNWPVCRQLAGRESPRAIDGEGSCGRTSRSLRRRGTGGTWAALRGSEGRGKWVVTAAAVGRSTP